MYVSLIQIKTLAIMTTITDAQLTEFAAAHEAAHPQQMEEFRRVHQAFQQLAALIPATEKLNEDTQQAYMEVHNHIYTSLYPNPF